MSATLTPQAKFVATREEMTATLIERDVEIDIVLTSLIAGHHPLLVGPPGTGKSLLGRTVAEWVDGRQFEILLNKFTGPEELFGPISVEGLKRDEYRRITEGTLVDADVAFFDEIFKASTAILNTTLGVINERKFRNGKTIVTCPLLMGVGASNEYPDPENGGRELGALFDRFLLRRTVQPIRSHEGKERLLKADDLTPRLSTRISRVELDLARTEAKAIPVTEEAWEAMFRTLDALKGEGIEPGDRRNRWAVGAAKAFAYLSGAKSVLPEHLEILAHALWTDPVQHPAKCAEIVAKTVNPTGAAVAGLYAEAKEIIAGVRSTDTEGVIAAIKKVRVIVDGLGKIGTDRAKMVKGLVERELLNLRSRAIGTV